MADPLAKEKVFLKQNQATLAEQYPGKYLLIKGEQVYGAFETYEQGVNAGVQQFGAGPFWSGRSWSRTTRKRRTFRRYR